MTTKKTSSAKNAGKKKDTFSVAETIFFRSPTYRGIGKITRISTFGKKTFLYVAESVLIVDTSNYGGALENEWLINLK